MNLLDSPWSSLAFRCCRAVAAHWRSSPPGAPEPILNVTIDPPRVVVGQRTTLRIDVLAPNYMTSPPELPGFQVRNAVTRQLQSVNLSEQRDGTSYAGVRFEFAIYPQEPGAFAISDQKVKVKYAAEPPAVREELLSLPRVSFEAFIPDAAADLNPFLAASQLTLEQSVQRSSDRLKVGDSITRTVTIQAEETPAMLLPPVTFPAVRVGRLSCATLAAGQDRRANRRSDGNAGGFRRPTFCNGPATIVLPAIDVRWWNAGEGRVETAHLDAVTMQVAPNPAVQPAETSAPKVRLNWTAIVDLIADNWLLALLATLVIAGLIGSHLGRCEGSQPIIVADGRRICNPLPSPSADFVMRSATATQRPLILPCLIGCRMLARQHRLTRSKPSRWLQGTLCWTARSTRSKPSCLRHNATEAVGRDVNCCTG